MTHFLCHSLPEYSHISSAAQPLPEDKWLKSNSLWGIHFYTIRVWAEYLFQPHLGMLDISLDLWICNSRQELWLARELLSFLGLLSKNGCLLRFSPLSPLLHYPFCSFQMFPLLPLPSPCCCALDQRWCWAGGPLPITAGTLCADTTWTRGKRAWKLGERSMSSLPKRGSLRSVMLQHDVSISTKHPKLLHVDGDQSKLLDWSPWISVQTFMVLRAWIIKNFVFCELVH